MGQVDAPAQTPWLPKGEICVCLPAAHSPLPSLPPLPSIHCLHLSLWSRRFLALAHLSVSPKKLARPAAGRLPTRCQTHKLTKALKSVAGMQVQVASGAVHTLLLCTSGKVYTCGKNEGGLLGGLSAASLAAC